MFCWTIITSWKLMKRIIVSCDHVSQISERSIIIFSFHVLLLLFPPPPPLLCGHVVGEVMVMLMMSGLFLPADLILTCLTDRKCFSHTKSNASRKESLFLKRMVRKSKNMKIKSIKSQLYNRNVNRLNPLHLNILMFFSQTEVHLKDFISKFCEILVELCWLIFMMFSNMQPLNINDQLSPDFMNINDGVWAAEDALFRSVSYCFGGNFGSQHKYFWIIKTERSTYS